MNPSDQVRFHGPVPVRAAWIVVESPLQIVAEPLATDVGRASIDTTTLPVIVDEQVVVGFVAMTV